jgi:long-chain acyl-CoA synthetase
MDDAADVTRSLTFHRRVLPAWAEAESRPATIASGVTRSYREHRERVFRLANAMRTALGVAPGGRFAVLALNSAEYIECYHAAYLGAGVINPLNIRLAGPEIAFILSDSDTEVVFVDRQFAPLIASIRDEVPSLRAVVLIGPPPDSDTRIDHLYEDLLASASPVEPPETDENDPTCLMYTGGTTGLPKGVLHTQRSHSLMCQYAQPLYGFDDASNYLAVTPLFHGASLGAYAVAPSLGLPVTVMPMFHPTQLVDLVESSQATHLVLVPTMVRMMLDAPGFDPARLSSLRTLTYGGSPMPAGVMDRLLQLFPNVDVVQAYGMTEGVPVSCLSGPDHRRGGALLRSAGRPVAGVTVSIRDEDGNSVAQGGTGEVCVRSGLFMREYWHRPDETMAAFRGGWYHSGDMGYLDADGYLFLVDRVKDMIVTGGENVYSGEVESAISTHPAVADVAVIGIPSAEWGEAVHAVVVLRPGAETTGEELIAHARTSIAGYKVPRSIDLRNDPLPLSGAGKTLKRQLREPFWADADRRVN